MFMMSHSDDTSAVVIKALNQRLDILTTSEN